MKTITTTVKQPSDIIPSSFLLIVRSKMNGVELVNPIRGIDYFNQDDIDYQNCGNLKHLIFSMRLTCYSKAILSRTES